MDIQNFVNEYNAAVGGKNGFASPYQYSIQENVDKRVTAICTVPSKPNATGCRSLDPWLVYFISKLENEGCKVIKIIVNVLYDENKSTIESLNRRLSYLCLNNGWDIEINLPSGSVGAYTNGENELGGYQGREDVIRSEYKNRSNNKEGKIEKDFQTFICGNPGGDLDEKINTNERLAIFGEDFYKLKSRKMPIAREFPTGAFRGKICNSSRILPTYFIDFITVNKYNQLSLIEFKLNDEKIDSIAQILDYALFVMYYKNQIDHILKECFSFNHDVDKKFVCYIANNHYHEKFADIEKYYSPRANQRIFYFEFKKIILGSTINF